MFRFLVKFFKVLAIACLIGVSLRVIEVMFLKEKTKDVAISNIVNETQNKEMTEISSNEEIEKKDNEEKENIVIETKQEADISQNIKKQDTVTEKKENIKVEQKTEKQEKTNNQTLSETTKQETKKEIKNENKYTEVKIDIAEKKECSGNKHGMEVGNSGKWFSTKDEAIATYKAEIKKWEEKLKDKENPISYDEYYKNCPYGYEIFNCPYCNKWTLNYYYDN